MEGLGLGGVLEDPGFEGLGGLEFAFAAEAVEEFDGNACGIAAVEGIEEEGFDGDFSILVKGGAGADVGDGVPGAVIFEVSGAGDIDAFFGEDFVFGGDVQGGDGLFRTNAMAGDDGACDAVGPAEEAPGAVELAVANGLAYESGGDDFAAVADGGFDVGGEAELAAEVGQKVDVAGLFVAEAEVVADDDGFRGERCAEDVADESVRGHGGEFFSEGEDEEFADAAELHGGDAVLHGGDAFGGAGGGDDVGGMGIEGEGGGGPFVASGQEGDFAEEFLVAEVDAVKVSDGEGAGAELAAGCVERAEDFDAHSDAVTVRPS